MIYQRSHRQSKQPARRLQSGVAGSVFIRTDEQLELAEQVLPIPETGSAADILAERDRARREKRARAARDRRKRHGDQIRKIKAAIAIPIEQRKEQARLKRESERIPSMNDGVRMTDLDGQPIGPRFARGGFGSVELDQMDQAGQQQALGGDFETSGDRGRITPEGRGIDPNGDKDESYDEPNESKSRFHVDLDVDASSRQRVMRHIFDEYIQDIGIASFPEKDGEGVVELPAAVCRLCLATIPRHSIGGHIIAIHGKEDEPGHDDRFGNVIERMSRRLIREDRNRARALKPERQPLEQFLSTKLADKQAAEILKNVSFRGMQLAEESLFLWTFDRREIPRLAQNDGMRLFSAACKAAKEANAAREGYVKGSYVWDRDRRRHVQGWVPAKKRG